MKVTDKRVKARKLFDEMRVGATFVTDQGLVCLKVSSEQCFFFGTCTMETIENKSELFKLVNAELVLTDYTGDDNI